MIKRAIFSLVLMTAISLNAEAASLSNEELRGNFEALPSVAVNEANPLNDAKVELGKMLFFEPRLSKSGFFSCNSCHNLATGGADNTPTSLGHKWNVGPRNAPTVLNAALNGTQFWDGRAKDVEEQAGGPILNPGEMADTEESVLKTLNSMPQYVELFKNAFKGEKNTLKYENVAKAIAAYERTLLTPSLFDVYLNGNDNALSKRQVKGLKLFVGKGCVGCHNGVNIGGGSFQKFDYGTDDGRYSVTKDEADKKVFRVPTLRNVALTAPYFHDGSVWDLNKAVGLMADKQLGIKLKKSEVKNIVAFLNSLNGELAPQTLPVLPVSTSTTPRPDFN